VARHNTPGERRRKKGGAQNVTTPIARLTERTAWKRLAISRCRGRREQKTARRLSVGRAARCAKRTKPTGTG
jgi:hypothetical protein